MTADEMRLILAGLLFGLAVCVTLGLLVWLYVRTTDREDA